MSSVDVDKTLLAFLNGLSRRQYFGEDQFSDQFLKEEVLGNIEDDGNIYCISFYITLYNKQFLQRC